MLTGEGIERALTLEAVDERRYRAQHAHVGSGVAFGGQLMAQALLAALAGAEGKAAKTLHMVFARGVSDAAPIELVVDPLHSGRALASSTVTIVQGDRPCARAMVLLSADEPDLVRHGDAPPRRSRPQDAEPEREHFTEAWEVRVVGGVDLADPEVVAEPDCDVWTRIVGAPRDAATGQALLAFVTDGFLIGAAMLPHRGVGQSQAHRTISTGVVSHTITFHEAVQAGDWWLLAQHSSYAGKGRCYGRGDVFLEDGALVASFVQDGLLRAMAPGGTR